MGKGGDKGIMETKRDLLRRWAQSLADAVQRGVLTRGQPVPIYRVEMVAGPRAGAVHLAAGLGAGKLLRVLAADDCALARQFIPWRFTGDPAVYMVGRMVRIEAGWPASMAEADIPLASLPPWPVSPGQWVAGKNELGQTVVLSLSDRTPHWLIGGTSGSGKTTALRAAAVQLAARDGGTRFVMADGKWGEGLMLLSRLRGLVGPVATDGETIRRALGWAVSEMRRRYSIHVREGYDFHDAPLVVVFDEFQEFIGRQGDPLIRELLRRLVAQGRAVHVHTLMATQHPNLESFGDPTIRRNLAGRVALRVIDLKASEVVVGSTHPRADHLLGGSDAYCITPRAIHRTQLAYVRRDDIAGACGGEMQFEEWPEFSPEDLGRDLPGQPGRPSSGFSPEELAVALEVASEGGGRPRLVRALEEAGLSRPGSGRADRLLRLARRVLAVLRQRGLDLVYEGLPENACLPENVEYALREAENGPIRDTHGISGRQAAMEDADDEEEDR